MFAFKVAANPPMATLREMGMIPVPIALPHTFDIRRVVYSD